MRIEHGNVSPSFRHGIILKVTPKGRHGSIPIDPRPDPAIESVESPPIDLHGNASPAFPGAQIKDSSKPAKYTDGYEDPRRDTDADPQDDWKKGPTNS